MPPKSKVEKTISKPKKTGPKGMIQSLASDLVLTDLIKNTWKLGPKIGQGGFGFIYSGAQLTSKNVSLASNSEYVIKVEPHANGPLYGEIAFYQRVAKAEYIDEWLKSKKKMFVGIPRYIATGSFDDGSIKYRFLVMERFGTDIEKVFKQCNMKFPEKTVCSLALRIIEALEYIHSKEYVHADIKSSNLMLGWKKSTEKQVYLLDYGLAYRYAPDGKHVTYKEDPKRKHDGTIEYTSRDAHRGCAPSRKGDLEILGYCMVQWLCSRLPWEDNLKDKNFVMEEKTKYMNDIPSFIKKCFPNEKPVYLQDYLKIIANMKYDEQPDYHKIKDLFVVALKKFNIVDDGVSIQLPIAISAQKKRQSMTEDKSPNKKKRISDGSLTKDVTEIKSKSVARLARSPLKDNNDLKKTKAYKRKLATDSIPADPACLTYDSHLPSNQNDISSLKHSDLFTISGHTVTRKPVLENMTRKPTVKKTYKMRNKEQTDYNGAEKRVNLRPRKRNVLTRDFGQSP
ncbi:serine/threonine-protein kinase VRK1 isoform X2 [Hydra vulgaris]|uniref:non-specific serine/threonine protein kinase n=1 Tax=Hydra vulgaris TaxID=6087 RepID=A0ABM4CHJ9_HYDVU